MGTIGAMRPNARFQFPSTRTASARANYLTRLCEIWYTLAPKPRVYKRLVQENSSLAQDNIAVVIPAGGGGTRLWPRSRQATPKQFLDIVSERTMLQETADRVASLIPIDQLFVITNAAHTASVHEQLPSLPTANVIGEPQGRDSAPAIGIMAALLEKTLGADYIMAVLPADHVIGDGAHFCQILKVAAEVALKGYLVTLGIPPTNPDTGFGYIQRADPICSDHDSGLTAYSVKQFKEKPDRESAERYLEEGGYFWNAGMFIAQVGVLRSLYKTFLPQYEEGFAKIIAAHGTPEFDRTLEEIFPTFEKISVDYGIAERASMVAVIPAEIGWNDVGSWARLAEVLSTDSCASENISIGHHVGVDTKRSLVYSPNRLIATIGVEDMIIIDTPDAILICPKSRSEDVKLIVEQLKSRGDHHLL